MGQQKSRAGGDDEGDHDERQRMRQVIAVMILALGKSGEELGDMLAEINRENQDRAQLDHDGIHLPVSAREWHVHEFFRQAQVSC